MIPYWAFLSLAAIVMISSAVSCNSGSQATPANSELTEAPVEERTVPVVPVMAQSFERTLALPGELVAFQDVALHARVQGFIESIRVDRSSVVRRGDLLARIDAPELSAQLSEAEAKVQSAEAQLLEAQAAFASERSTFDRLKQASATPGVVAGNDVDVAQQKMEAASARVEASNRNVEAMRQSARSFQQIRAYLEVTAPFDGVITERSAHIGSLVGPTSPPIVRMQQVSTLRLVAAIPEAFIALVGTGEAITFTVTTFPGETFAAKLARPARALDPKTRTMAVELDVNNADGRVSPGMFAEVRWPARRASSSLFVPRTAVATTTERTFVVRVHEGVAEWVDVKRGATMDDLIEVFGNLNVGEEVALRATDEIRNGTAVRAIRQSAP
ncbi:MAG: efflux RND transporter periplasmic adaptor subunit [Vicinamibacterales bacterium]